jgi:NAD(P)-dependent dehydrogenase (short-subunit alcohol dehydrogenase family)
MAVKERTLTADGIEQQFGVNHCAHFLLFQQLRHALLADATAESPSRVVMLASSGHRFNTVLLGDINFDRTPYDSFKSYGQSKTCNIWMALEIERRYGSKHLHATAVMPGAIVTNLARHMDASALDHIVTSPEYAKMWKNPEQGAATSVWAAVGADWERTGGAYLEDVRVAVPCTSDNMLAPGFAPHAFDREGATKLWDLSNAMVGLMREDEIR